jgi:hypothetical protein
VASIYSLISLDLIANFRKSVEVLRSNLLLFLPALIIFYLIPVALLIVAAYVLVPIIVVALKGASPLSTLPQGLLLGVTIIIVLAVLAYVYVLSGAANLNRKAVQTGRTSMDDFWEGCRKYFGKVLGGVILLGIIYGIIIAIGVILTLSIILPNIVRLTAPESIGEFPIRTFEPERIARLTSWLLEVFKMISDPLWIWLVLSTAAGLIFIFTLFWIQALVVDEVGILRAIGRSIKFVKNTFKTTLGIIGLWIIAQGFTRAIFPGGGMGGGGPGYGYGFGFPPPLQAIFQLFIATFFTLLLYTVYMDKTGKTA